MLKLGLVDVMQMSLVTANKALWVCVCVCVCIALNVCLRTADWSCVSERSDLNGALSGKKARRMNEWNEMKRVSDFGREVQSLCFALNSGITPNVSLPCNHSVQIHSLQERGCKNKDAIVRRTRQTRVKPCPRSSSKLVLTISESQKVSAEEDMLMDKTF